MSMKSRTIIRKELWTKQLISWYLYDFANSVFVISGSLYFSQWIIADRGLTDFWFGFPFMVATGLLIFVSPYIGEIGDKNGSHQKILRWSTILAIIAGAFIYLSAHSSSSLKSAVIALVFYGLFNFLYQLALVPYGVFMKLNAKPEDYGTVSGIGYAFNELGYVVGILVTLPAVRNFVGLSGSNRLSALIPAVLVFTVSTIPALIFLRSKPIARDDRGIDQPLSSLKRSLIESRKHPGMLLFLIAFYFFSDAILSIQLYAAIYLQKVFGAADTLKAFAFMLVVIAATLGASISGAIADRKGHRRVLIYCLALNIVSIAGIALCTRIGAALIFFPLFGFSMGGAYASSRSYFASLFSNDESGKFFGLYAFSERCASVVGPAIWGGIIYFLASLKPWNYRIAALAMAAIVLISLGVIVRSGRKERLQM